MKLQAELRGMATAGLMAYAAVLLMISFPVIVPGIELLQTLRFHLVALGLPLAGVLLFAGARWRALLVIPMMAVSLWQGSLPIIEGYQRRAEIAGDTLTTINVLSYNVLASRDGKAAADYIISAAPDIAVIMETPGIAGYLDQIAEVLPYRFGCDDRKSCDLSIFSRTPITDARMFLMPPIPRERLAVVKTVINDVPVTVVGMHLSKPYFDEASWSELQRATRVINAVEGRVIVAGDYNAAAWSDQVADFSARTGLVPPPWHPATWPVRLGPLGVPIDNMFTRGDVVIDEISAVADSYGSNHRALWARVNLLAPPQ